MDKQRYMWQQIPSTIITEILCSNEKLTGVILDLEHGCFNNETLYACIQVATLKKKKVLVRFADVEFQLLRMCLDAGVDGIIMSTVETADHVYSILQTCKYAYSRGQGLVRENYWCDKNLKSIRKTRDKELLLIAQIETEQAVDNIEDIINDEITYYMVGPYDLSASIGYVGDFESPKFVEAMDKIKNACGDKLGYHIVKNVEEQYTKLNHCNFLALGMDTLFLIDNMKNMENLI